MELKKRKNVRELSVEAKDIAYNIGITLDWVLRLEKDPSRVNTPDDKYEHPKQAVMSITQAITFINELKAATINIDYEKTDALCKRLHGCLYWACRVFNDQKMVISASDSVNLPHETTKVLFDTRAFLRECIPQPSNQQLNFYGLFE